MKNTRQRLGDEEKMASEFGGGDVGFLLFFFLKWRRAVDT
jgi:hypothetical protein